MTIPGLFDEIPLTISIHTPLAGSDDDLNVIRERCKISIHTPLAGSDAIRKIVSKMQVISIHTPLAGSDNDGAPQNRADSISIHTPLAGSDTMVKSAIMISMIFQSTLPSRGVTAIPHSIMQIFTHVHGGIAQIISFLHSPSFLQTSSTRKFPVRTHWQYPVHLWFALHRISGSSTLISRFTP